MVNLSKEPSPAVWVVLKFNSGLIAICRVELIPDLLGCFNAERIESLEVFETLT